MSNPQSPPMDPADEASALCANLVINLGYQFISAAEQFVPGDHTPTVKERALAAAFIGGMLGLLRSGNIERMRPLMIETLNGVTDGMEFDRMLEQEFEIKES